jgi:glutathione S-transferase
MTAIYHLATAEAWAEAQAAGSYRESTRGLSLAEVGFIHCSYAHQVPRVARTFYADVPDLVLLTIDPERLTAELREDRVQDTGEVYPHIYGPLNLEAVVDVAGFEVPEA